MTGWAYREIVSNLPLSAGLQIIDADLFAKGIDRVYSRGNASADFDSLAIIDAQLEKLRRQWQTESM